MRVRFIYSMIAALFLTHSAAALAQSNAFVQSNSDSPYLLCLLYPQDGSNRVYVAGPFSLRTGPGPYPDEELLRDYRANGWKQANATCLQRASLEAAQALVDHYISQGTLRYREDWHPTGMTLATAPNSATRALTLDFEPGDKSLARGGRGGYRTASIKLNYRFLLCANEIQIAYGIDRKSLEHSADYVDRFNGINPNLVTPSSEPPMPNSVPIDLGVYIKGGSVRYRYETKLADVRDKIAGEALGMGCFTGQTKTIGTVAKLLGPDPKITRQQIKAFLDELIVKEPFGNYTLDFPLVNPDVPVPPRPAPRAPVRRKAK